MEYNAETALLIETSRKGDRMRDFKESEHYAAFIQIILDPLDRKAFETFKRVDPASPNDIIQAQMASKIVDQIKQEIESVISQGDLAKEYLRNEE